MATLGNITITQPEDLDTGQGLLNQTASAMLALAQRGLVPAGPPSNSFKGEMPSQLTSLDDAQLGDLLGNLANWCGFVDEELTKAASERNSAKEQLDFTESRIRLAIRADESHKKLTVQDKNDIVATDPRVVQAKSRALYTETIYTLTRTILNTGQRNWETVSRRITQRGQEADRGRRGESVGGQHHGSPHSFRRPAQPNHAG